MPIDLTEHAALPAVPLARARLADDHSPILVVDDNAEAADALAELSRLYGHEVTVAYSASQAMEAFELRTLQIAIFDIGLPGMTGYALSDAMRAIGKNPDARYIALTGFGHESAKERTAAARFAGHLVKPVEMEALLALV